VLVPITQAKRIVRTERVGRHTNRVIDKHAIEHELGKVQNCPAIAVGHGRPVVGRDPRQHRLRSRVPARSDEISQVLAPPRRQSRSARHPIKLDGGNRSSIHEWMVCSAKSVETPEREPSQRSQSAPRRPPKPRPRASLIPAAESNPAPAGTAGAGLSFDVNKAARTNVARREVILALDIVRGPASHRTV